MSGLLSRPLLSGVFNGTGSAGPRRLLVICAGIALLVGAIFGVASIQSKDAPVSRPGVLPRVDPLPGGLHSNPQQDTLSVIANQEQATRAQQQGSSYTPVMPASRPFTAPRGATALTPAQSATPASAPAQAEPAPSPPIVQPVTVAPVSPPVRVVPVAAPAASPVATPVAAQAPLRTPQEDAAFKTALDRMMAGWGGRPPRTEVVLPPEEAVAAEGGGQIAPGQASRRLSGDGAAQAAPQAATQVSASAARQTVLVPAGRGIYAHTILAANSDAQSPVVLQADSGPIAGDRMIGTFSRERNRLVIRVTKVIHQNREIGVDGVVVAPGTMAVGVASSVDQNYLSRFALPAAAAFVQGLGQAIAQSNQTTLLGPLGTVTAQNQLNFNQQLGIAAGVAAAQIGSTLQQSAPRGPTVTLDVGSSVGVLFLANVSANS
jgi:intracellular multiplication protein IcmE